ncbi:LOW QUALITY PROTEIN: uncharacterized protein LOC128718203 [Anopheles marshallii]|uniref:LOW QUALITY PROTEIN: uncharacterized protein LOC128718203 n=1 Tax=Anopheles marshallii TaxID=1521116 RepID=UPI00237AF139|nr:LOW QUALITY PROTEIN: uncharacterized protein LOC128718203 [Anopheles marshallii]
MEEDGQNVELENTKRHGKRKIGVQISTSTTNREEDLNLNVPKDRFERHNNSYQVDCTFLVLLGAYEKQQNDKQFNFTITLEDQQGGKFDDIVLRCPTQNIAVYMQCKYDTAQIFTISKTQNDQNKKQKAIPTIVESALLAPWNSTQPYSICLCFISFLESNHSESGTNLYVLCTNAEIDDEVKQYFMEEMPSTTFILSCYRNFGRTLYQLNKLIRWVSLEEKLRNASLSCLGKSLAQSIYHQYMITLTNQLHHAYAVLIMNIIEPSTQDVTTVSISNQQSCNYKFKQDFINANNNSLQSSAMCDLRRQFIIEYTQLLKKDHTKKDVWKDVIEKGIKIEWHFTVSAMNDAFNLMNNPSSVYSKIDEKIGEFYDKFRFVCTPNEEILRNNAKQLISKLTDAEPEATYNSLYNSVCNVMKTNKTLHINGNFLNDTFRKVKRNTTYAQLKELSKEYIKSLTKLYGKHLIKQECLKNSIFYEHLTTNSFNGIYYYCSSVDLNVSSIVLLQTLTLCAIECLFIDGTKFPPTKSLQTVLNNVFEYLNVVKDLTHCIIVVLDEFESATAESLKNLHPSYQRRLIILTNENSEARSEKCLLVRDLTEEARNKLYKENEQLRFFGTTISLQNIVQESDDLAFLFNVLKFNDKPTECSNINLNNYEKIKKMYVLRDIQTYGTCMTPDDLTNRDIKKYFKDLFSHDFCSFEEIAQNPNARPIFSLVQSALLKSEDQRKTSAFLDNNSTSKFKIFLDEAGFGKSTYFTWLTWHLANEQPSRFIIKLHAIEYSSEFYRLKKMPNQLDDTDVVRILFQFISIFLYESNIYKRSSFEKKELCANLLNFSKGQVWLDNHKTKGLTFEQILELRLFCNKFNEQQLILLLDAYDEIVPEYSDVVIKCFEWFAKFDGIRFIYLSSRPSDFQGRVKTTFKNCDIFQLKPFARHHQILSIHKHFLNGVTQYSHCEESHKTVVLGVVYVILNNRLEDLITCPQFLHMAIAQFLPIMEQHINFSSKNISGTCFSNEHFNTFEIVQSFVQKKLEILTTDKSGSTDTSLKTVVALRTHKLFMQHFERQHALMAISVMFDKSFIKLIPSSQELIDIKKNIIQGEEKTGIIVGIKNDIPLFVHRIFAEYFAAAWMYYNKKTLQTHNYFKSQLFWIHGLDRTRDFFNHIIVREHPRKDLHLAVLNKSFEQVKAILLENPSCVTSKNVGGRTPLHLALQHDNHQIMRLLLEKMSIHSINAKDDIFGWSAIDYAFVTSNKSAIKFLLELGASLSLDALLEQLLSNDNDNLLIQACHYINNLTSVEETEMFAKNTVIYLYNERRVDINVPREQLKNLTMIEYCISQKTYELFKQFILHLDNPMSYLSTMANQLFQAAFAKNAYNIVYFLVDEFNLYPPQFKNTSTLFAALKSAIEMDRIKSFQMFLDQLCFRLNIDFADDTMIVVEDSFINSNTASLAEFDDQFPKSCCIRKCNNVLLTLPEYDCGNVVVKDHLFETLLAQAAHMGHVHMMSHIIQKFQKHITNRTIVTVMRLLPKGKRMLHKQSVRAFKYLLEKTNDLESIDAEGRNLLHMTIQNGCYFMVLCIIETRLNRTLINERNLWNVFHYIASSESNYTNRALKLYQYFKSIESTERFDTVDIADNSVYEIAILNINFDMAKEMIERTLIDPTTSSGLSFVLNTVSRLVDLHKLDIVLEYFKYLFQYGDIPWMELYSTIRQRVPVI